MNLKIDGRIRRKKAKKKGKKKKGWLGFQILFCSFVLQFSGLEFFCRAIEFLFGMLARGNKLYFCRQKKVLVLFGYYNVR